MSKLFVNGEAEALFGELLKHYQKPSLNVGETAKALSLSAVTLQRLRSGGTGPRWKKTQGRIIYPLHELANYLVQVCQTA